MHQIRKASVGQLTTLRKLRLRKYRNQYQRFIVEGTRATIQVIGNDVIKTECLFFKSSSREWEKALWQPYYDKIPLFYLTDNDFDEITDALNPQPVLAICVMPQATGVETLLKKQGLIMALDRIQDPGNLGTILRTAVWFGVGGLLLGSGTVDLFNPKVIRSTAGSIGGIDYVEGNMGHMLDDCEKHDWRIVLLEDRKNAQSLSGYIPGSGTVLVVGNEGEGIERKLHQEGRISLKINGESSIESLNAAIAAGIAMYEISKKLKQ